MKYFFLFFFIFNTCIINAQEYNALYIPDSLVKGADVVNRSEEYVLTIKSAARYTLYEKHVYTILNEAGSNHSAYSTFYDRFNSINSVSGRLYNSMGTQINHTKKSDWEDKSYYDGFSLLSDARYKKHSFYNSQYPYTVAFEEEDECNGTLGFPRWMPQKTQNMSVQFSKFTINAPEDYKIRFKQLNFKTEPLITKTGNVITYTWEIKNIPAKKYEIAAPPFIEIAPVIIFAPSKFEVQGYEGDMSTWENYGKFIYKLLKGRDVLPDEIKRRIHELTDGIKTDREKIFVLYDFLQKNTRYVSVQLGIGGWQPFEAGYVAQNKYGDCKALSNYMISLLKEAGISGKYVEIYAGSSPPPFIDDFSFSQANHVIACVPLFKDTIWLECTSQTKSAGYMGDFTGNRNALLIDEAGGHLVHTPVYNAIDNLQVRTVKAVADEDGNINADINSHFTGLQQDFPHALIHEASKEEREKYLNQMFNMPTYQILKNEYKEQKGIIPSVDEYLKIILTNYATISGKRLFIIPNLFGGAATKPFADTARQYDYLIKSSYIDIDSVEISIQPGYKPESIPKDVAILTKFGNYTSSIKVTDSKIYYYRMIEQKVSRVPPKEYNDLVNFYEQVAKADRNKIVLVKNE